MATLKPTTPLLTPRKELLKPASPLHPKNAPKTPISHPQRRWRFQPHTDTSEQRRHRFQITAHLAYRARLRLPDTAPKVGVGARLRHPWAAARLGRATGGRPTLQTSSNQRDSNRLTSTSVTNVVNLSQKTTIFSEKALRLTTFVTTGQKATQKTPWIDDVCNNTHQSTPKTQHTRPHRHEGRRKDRRARGGFETTRRTNHQHTQPTGVEGTGGTCRSAGGRRRGLAGLRDDAPSEARSADGERAGRRPRAHTAAGPSGARNTSGATNTATAATQTQTAPTTPPQNRYHCVHAHRVVPAPWSHRLRAPPGRTA